MYKRDYRNLKLHSGTAVLRNKVLFGFFTNSLGINSGRNLGIVCGQEVFDLERKTNISLDMFLKTLQGYYIFKPIE